MTDAHLLRSRRSIRLQVRLAAFVVTCAFGCLAPSAAFAQSASEINVARQIATDGLAAYNANEFEKALGLFSQARAIYPSGQILRMVGYSEIGLERWTKAVETLEAALATTVAPLKGGDRKDAEDQLAKAMSHFGKVTITTNVAGATVSVDGDPAKPLPLEKPLRLAEGQHKFVVSAKDRTDATAELKVEGGKAQEVALDPQGPVVAPPPPPPVAAPPARTELIPHQRSIAFGALGTGAAFGVIAVVTGIEAAHYRSQANTDVASHVQSYGGYGCQSGNPTFCAFDVRVTNQEVSLADTFQNTSVGFAVAAGALALGGGALLLLAPKAQNPEPRQGGLPSDLSLSCSLVGGPGLACYGAF